MKKLVTLMLLTLSIYTLKAADLHINLETCYKHYVDAINAKDIDQVKATMSTHSFVSLKNYVVSSKLKFPEDLFTQASMKMVNLKKEHFINAHEKANTASCLYYGKGIASDKALIIIKFIKEGDYWKFDELVEKSNEEIVGKINNKDLSFAESKEYLPTGNVPGIPKEVAATDYKGTLNLHVEGYKITTMKINAVSQELTGNTVTDALVIGGLKKGINFIEVKLTPIYGAETKNVEVYINANIKNQEKNVFTYKTDQPSIIFTKEFEIK